MCLRPKHYSRNSSFLSAFIPQPTHLTKLHINIDNVDNLYVDPITKLISCYQSSLEDVNLTIHTDLLTLDGKRLETLFRPCQRLEKLVFVLEYTTREINMLEQLHEFQSDWWLNDRQPPVFIHRDSDGHTFFCTMPCAYPLSLSISTDLKKLLLSKGNLDPWLIYFTKVKKINFITEGKKPITLDLIHFISQMFRSCHQELSFTHWKLALPYRISFEQVCFYLH